MKPAIDKYPTRKDNESYYDWFKRQPKAYWINEHKKWAAENYLWRVRQYERGLENEHIMKSTFGHMSPEQILSDIKYWFNASLGVHTQITYK